MARAPGDGLPQWSWPTAVGVVVMLPVLIPVFLGRRYLSEGLATGSLQA